MRVVHIQYSPESSGRAALRLHNAFLENNIISNIVSLQNGLVESDKIKYLGRRSKLKGKIDYKIQKFIARKTNRQFGQFTYPIFGTDVSELEEVVRADVIYLHWILWGMLNLKNIEKLAKLGKPVFFFMHDMWTITGGCHHSFSCDKYTFQCSQCHIFNGTKVRDLSYSGYNKKEKLYSRFDNLHFISPSKWLLECAKRSILLKNKQLFYLPNLIDNNIFKPVGKEIARNILGLKTEENVIAFGAVSIESPYKGWGYLKNALEILSNDKSIGNTTVLIFGGGNKEEVVKSIPFNTRFMGYLRDEYSMILAYNAMDVLITPSLADNQPTTVMESLCCGTPVVGFDVGGIPDMIKHMENGYLVKYKDAEDLAAGIKFCLSNKIQGGILPGFEKKLIMNKHLEMIESVLKFPIL